MVIHLYWACIFAAAVAVTDVTVLFLEGLDTI